MPNTLPPLLRRALRLAAVFAALLLAGLLYVALVGVSIDAARLRTKAATALTERLGREVRIDGTLAIRVSAHPSLVIRGMQIANAAGFDGEQFASLGEARLALNLWPLLRSRLSVQEISGSDVHLRLQKNARGENNWTFAELQRQSAAAPAPAAQSGLPQLVAQLLARFEIQRLSLQQVNLEFTAANGKMHFFTLQSLLAQLPAGQPFSLAMRGSVEQSFPYQLDVQGGTAADLARRDQPWPLALTLDFLGSHLSIDGSITESSGSLRFGLGTQDSHEFERLLQIKLPAVGQTGIAGVIRYSPGHLALTELNGVMGKTAVHGGVEIDYGGDRPKVRGDLTIPVLDLRPFITSQPALKNEPPRDFADIYRELDQATFRLNDLNDADADLTLHVGQWISLPGAVHDALLRVHLDHGRLTLPVQGTVAGVSLSGSTSIDATVAPARFELSLGTRNSDVGDLAKVLAGIPGVRGTLGRFDLQLTARGDRGSDLMKSLDLRLNLERGRLSYGNAGGARPVNFSLNDLRLVLQPGKPLQCDAHGSLIDAAFHASLHGISLAELMQSAQAPIDFELQAGSARAQVHAIVRPATLDLGSEATFQLSAPHSKEIAGWLGLRSGADAPLQVQGSLQTDSQRWHLGGFTLQLGRSALSADVRRTVEAGKPLLTLNLTADLIDAQELQGLMAEKAANHPAATSAAADLIDIPILPVGISLADADIAVRVKRIASTPLLTMRDLRFDGNIRNGMMNASPFSASVADVDFTGAILLDLRTGQPHAAVWLAAPSLDVGRILKALGIAPNIDAGVGALSLQLDMHSSRLGQVLVQSQLLADFDGGHLTLQDANSAGKMSITIAHGALKAAPGAPIQLDLQGSLDQLPVSIGIRTAKAADLLDPNGQIPFVFEVRAAESSLTLSGEVDRPFSNQQVYFTLDLQGRRLDTLNALTRTSLPPWGPWSASAKFRVSRSGYEMPSLLVQVGGSRLTGNGKIDTTTVPPGIVLVLEAPSIQLDDFRFGNWSAETSNPEPDRKKASLSAVEEAAAKESDRAQQLLSPAVLKRQNAKVTVNVEQVVSGRDKLGSGQLEANLNDGHIVIGPVTINTSGGSATFRLGYKPRDASVGASLRVGIQHFDYGILARRIDPNSQMRGQLNLDLDVKAHAPSISELLRHGTGHIDFEVWPENMKAGLLDFWALNVLAALLPAIDSSSTSKVNCAIGRFALTDGELAQKTFLVDTTRMRVTAKAHADFKSEDIELYAQPRSKTPQLLAFPLPVEVSGKFTDFHIGVRTTDVLQTVAEFATSAIWVPIEIMFGKGAPSDGHDVCSASAK